jgi:hypothetical protein
MSNQIPSLAGSCLCGSISFKIAFPFLTSWPPSNIGTCQCNNCRKFTGALVPKSFQVPTIDIQPALASLPTYKTYASGPNSFRGFCINCGSSLTHNDEEGRTEIWLGCIEVEDLCGMKDGHGIQTDYGTIYRRTAGFGKELCKADFHAWVANAVVGITDQESGPKYWRNREDGMPFEKDVTTLWVLYEQQASSMARCPNSTTTSLDR